MLTPLAARELWDREAQGADVLDDASVQRLDAVIRADVKRATAFQALLEERSATARLAALAAGALREGSRLAQRAALQRAFAASP